MGLIYTLEYIYVFISSLQFLSAAVLWIMGVLWDMEEEGTFLEQKDKFVDLVTLVDIVTLLA